MVSPRDDVEAAIDVTGRQHAETSGIMVSTLRGLEQSIGVPGRVRLSPVSTKNTKQQASSDRVRPVRASQHRAPATHRHSGRSAS